MNVWDFNKTLGWGGGDLDLKAPRWREWEQKRNALFNAVGDKRILDERIKPHHIWECIIQLSKEDSAPTL